MTHREMYDKYHRKSYESALLAKKCYDDGNLEEACKKYHSAYATMKIANGILVAIIDKHGISAEIESVDKTCLGKACNDYNAWLQEENSSAKPCNVCHRECNRYETRHNIEEEEIQGEKIT